MRSRSVLYDILVDELLTCAVVADIVGRLVDMEDTIAINGAEGLACGHQWLVVHLDERIERVIGSET